MNIIEHLLYIQCQGKAGDSLMLKQSPIPTGLSFQGGDKLAITEKVDLAGAG